MPEEINRMATDAIVDLLWTPSSDADENLLREGVAPARICRVGNIMIDALEMCKKRIAERRFSSELGLDGRKYGLVTLHRPSNVDDRRKIGTLVEMLEMCATRLPLVFSVHPRTRQRLLDYGLWSKVESIPQLCIIEPVGYVEFMSLVISSSAVITDSGGVQEETTYLGIPCITLRENTERPITVLQGTNRLMKPEQAPEAVAGILEGKWQLGRKPDLWDGKTAGRVVANLKQHLLQRGANR
jgi:UDP-N-acetylglucosamine 2-epimerase (non-hydrolysing)